MNIRFTASNEEIINILEKVDKNNRKYFIQEAILNYYYQLEHDPNKNSIFIKVDKKDNNYIVYK